MHLRNLLIKLCILFVLAHIRNISSTFSAFTSEQIVIGNLISASDNFDSEEPFDPTQQIVLNEILPNPEGADTQHGLLGEWVEIYNKSNQTINVLNWYVEDASHHVITIDATSTNMGRTNLGAKGTGSEWLVVFMNGAILNNNTVPGDTVTLYSNNNIVVDSYSYRASTNDDDSLSSNTPDAGNEPATENPANEGKSFARIPDGTGDWIDPIPTPEAENEIVLNTVNNEAN